jgi:hypothetical protein
MQFVNDDMDDELFRRAAEEYPLITDNGDWNKVLNKMQAGGNSNSSNKKGSKSKYLFLLALIPLLLICTTYIKNDSSLAIKLTGQEDKLEQPSAENKIKEAETSTGNNGSIAKKQHEAVIKTGTTAIQQERKFFAGDYNHDRKNNDIAVAQNSKKNTESFFDKEVNSEVKIDEVSSGTIEAGNNKSSINDQEKQEATNADQNSLVADVDKKTVTPQPAEMPTTTAAKTNNEKTNKKPESKFYFGFQGGPDFSMVKSTNISRAGYSIGLLVGYNFSKNFAVETGILWDRKEYQSEGQYFKTEKLDWPHVQILDLSGFCNMYEIPLNFRYNVSSNSKRTWFANAGLSSYLMKKENYDYNYERYGVYAKGNKEYKNTTNNWLSVAHLSIGVQKKLGSIGDLRIEPYVKLPVNGVGIGSMPLRSTGIYLGITRAIR